MTDYVALAEQLGYIHVRIQVDEYVVKWYWKDTDGKYIGSIWGYERDEVPDEILFHIASLVGAV